MAKQINRMTLPGFSTMELSVSCRSHHREEHVYQLKSHCHQRCEIYVNLSRQVAFAVEGRIYPISCGDVVITRPLEYHNCLYRGDAVHAYYWILFTCKGNEALLSPFFNRPIGEGNHIRLPQEERQRMLEHCRALTEADLTPAAQYQHFWGIIRLLEIGRAHAAEETERQSWPEPLELALAYLAAHLSGTVSVREMATAAHVSINTMERLFRQYTDMTPVAYIRNRRLQEARTLLEHGQNITETALSTGFCDSSYFILQFKRKYGVTPYQYQRSISSEL